MLALSKLPNVKIFRNNVAMAWTGKSAVMNERKQIWVNHGDVIIHQGRPLHAGLCVGSSDLIGFKSIIVTPDMIGRTVAVFTAVEVKSKSGKLSAEQIAFINMVQKSGGIAFMASDENEALRFIN